MSSAAEQELPAQQVQLPVTTGAVTPQALMQTFGLTEEAAVRLAQALPTLCGATQQPIPPQSFNTETKDQPQQPPLTAEEQAELREFLIGLTEEIQEFPELLQGQGRQQPQPPAQGQPPIPGQIPQQPPKPEMQFPWQTNSIDQSPQIRIIKDKNGTKMQMYDSFSMDIVKDTVVIEDGVLTADAVMTAAMVQTYAADGGQDKQVLKCPDELKKACDAWKAGIPITNSHPEEGMVMNQDEIVGWTTPPMWDKKNKNVGCSIQITDGPTIDAIQKGKTDVSIGFFCDLDDTPGVFDGTDYAAVQRNIVFNHLAAGLDKGRGRCPNGKCGIRTDEEIQEGTGCQCCAHYRDMCEFLTADAQLTATQRKALAPETFCGPGRSFPVPDCAHYTAALRLLGRYQGEGDKEKIKDCIEARGKTLSCPTAEDQESLHAQIIKEQTEALIQLTKKATAVKDPEEMEALFDGIRELMWKLKDNLRIASAMSIASVDTVLRTAAAVAIGDAAILQHQITNQAGTKTMKAGKYTLMAGLPDTHTHIVTLDTEGNGTSSVTDEHSHKVVAMDVKLANGHTHNLSPSSSQEESPMDKKPEVIPEPEVDEQDSPPAIPPVEEPKDKAPIDDEAPPADAPPVKDEATTYVENLMKEEHTTLVDSIMDCSPPQERTHYEDKSNDELRELVELLKSQHGSDGIPGAVTSTGGSNVIDDAYSVLEKKLQTK